MRAALERTRGQLEEREFLIRRLERSESNNANVLGSNSDQHGKAGIGGPAERLNGGAGSGMVAGIDPNRRRSKHQLYPGPPHAHRARAGLRTAHRLLIGEPPPCAHTGRNARGHHRGSQQHQRRDPEWPQGDAAGFERRRHRDDRRNSIPVRGKTGAAGPQRVIFGRLSDFCFIGAGESGIFRALTARLAQR